jgi:hypothetical protein
VTVPITLVIETCPDPEGSTAMSASTASDNLIVFGFQIDGCPIPGTWTIDSYCVGVLLDFVDDPSVGADDGIQVPADGTFPVLLDGMAPMIGKVRGMTIFSSPEGLTIHANLDKTYFDDPDGLTPILAVTSREELRKTLTGTARARR